MPETHQISQPPSAIDAREESRAICASARAAVAAAKETGARKRQLMIELREECRAICERTQAAIAASKEALARYQRAA
jgi:hypothetical protein